MASLKRLAMLFAAAAGFSLGTDAAAQRVLPEAAVDTVIISSTAEYTGQYPEGQGELRSLEKGLVLGTFRYGVPDGYAVQYLPDGSRYRGGFRDGKAEGHGTLFSASGQIITGDFRDGRAEGIDTMFHDKGTVYIGTFKGGKPTREVRKYQSAASAELSGRIPVFDEAPLTKEQKKFLKTLKKNWAGSTLTDRDATFRGGGKDKFWHEWVKPRIVWKKGMKYNEGWLMLRFTVETDGSVTDIEVVKSAGEDFDREAVRVVGKSPAWEPAVKDGQFVPQTISMKINFLQEW